MSGPVHKFYKQMKSNQIAGYAAGIITGVTYGLNPLFAVPLMKDGVNVESILFFRYFLAVMLLGLWLVIRRQNFRVSGKQAIRLIILGLLFTAHDGRDFRFDICPDHVDAGDYRDIHRSHNTLQRGQFRTAPMDRTSAFRGIRPCLCNVHCNCQPEHQDKDNPEYNAHFLRPACRFGGILRNGSGRRALAAVRT